MNRIKLIVFCIIIGSMVSSCKKPSNDEHKKTSVLVNRKIDPVKSAKEKQKLPVIPKADITSFFPIIEGSYWVYEQFMEGTLESGNKTIDSVIHITQLDSGFKFQIKRTKANGSPEIMVYTSDMQGYVFLKGNLMDKEEVFCKYLPQPGDTISTEQYSNYLNKHKSRIRLETSNFETASYEEQLEWQGKIFQKGVGLVSYGGASLSRELVEYRIGYDGEIIKPRE